MKPIRWLALLLLSVLLAPAQASLEAGVEALQQRDYDTAFAELLPAARAGNARAQLLLATLYRRGYGVTQSYAKAVEWYRRAAEQGLANAQYNLAVHYREGLGVPRDDAAATEWFRAAARRGFAPAQVNLAMRYAEGRTVERDPVLAYAWLHRATLQGDVQALRRRTRIARELSAEEIERARKLAATLY